MRLENRVAIVTGGGRGVGEHLARRLAQEGASVMVADINLENAERVVRSIAENEGRPAHAFRADVTQWDEVQAMVGSAVDKWGRLDILVSNAGILIAAPIEEFPEDAWRQVVDVNLIGYFLCAKAAARVMIPQRRGNIIQINSKTGKRGSYKNSAYAASKFGGIGLTQSLALELAEYGIRVNCVCPGNLLDSPLWKESLFDHISKSLGITVEEVRKRYISQVPMKRPCTFEDVANVVVFLASDESSYMTGQAINVTGGQVMG